MSRLRQYCTFFLEGTCLGVDVLGVQEVLNTQHMTPVPRANEDILGLINLRGQIVTAVDLKRRLNMAGSLSEAPMNIILRAKEGAISLLVDEIGDVLEVPLETLEAVPETVGEVARSYLEGVHKLPTGLLAVLDIDKLCTPRS